MRLPDTELTEARRAGLLAAVAVYPVTRLAGTLHRPALDRAIVSGATMAIAYAAASGTTGTIRRAVVRGVREEIVRDRRTVVAAGLVAARRRRGRRAHPSPGARRRAAGRAHPGRRGGVGCRRRGRGHLGRGRCRGRRGRHRRHPPARGPATASSGGRRRERARRRGRARGRLASPSCPRLLRPAVDRRARGARPHLPVRCRAARSRSGAPPVSPRWRSPSWVPRTSRPARWPRRWPGPSTRAVSPAPPGTA